MNTSIYAHDQLLRSAFPVSHINSIYPQVDSVCCEVVCPGGGPEFDLYRSERHNPGRELYLGPAAT